MRQFHFTRTEILKHTTSHEEWHEFVRRREAEIAFALWPGMRFSRALELGAGNGGQSLTIAKYCDHLVCTEKDPQSYAWLGQTFLERKIGNVDYQLCDAEDLSCFGDRTFDLVFSSNLLEHVVNIDRCLQEFRRVLTDDGWMLHLMPSRWWRVAHAALGLKRLRLPNPHGVSANLLQEFVAFGANVWCSRFEDNQLRVEETVGMPFYAGHGASFLQVLRWGNALRLPSSFLYVVRK
jgi:SAM-dependent methyltransferase